MKRIILVTTLLSVFLLTGCNNPTPGPEPTPTTTLPVEFDFDSTSPAEVTVTEYESKEIKIKFKEESYKNNAETKTWEFEEKYKGYIEKVNESEDKTSYTFKALKATEEKDPVQLKITVTSKDGLATSTVSKTCSITIKPHTHKKGEWIKGDTEHWKVCEVCGEKLDIGKHYANTWKSDPNNHWKECEVCGKELDKSSHVKSSKWKHDYDNHWHECTVCGEKLDKAAHQLDSNLDCSCGYHEPTFIVDEGGVLTGLTNYGKALTTLKKEDNNDFKKAWIIEQDAFKGCTASIVVPKNVIIIHKDAFKDVDPSKISYEEGATLVWHKYGDYNLKEDLSDSNVAMVNGIFYPTLKEAIQSIKDDNTIIKLIRPVVEESDEIEINKNIFIEPLSDSTNLETNFSINPGKQLMFGKNINFKGSVALMTNYEKENCGEEEIDCVNSGSIGFPEKPIDENVSIKYFYQSSSKNLLKRAAGATQEYFDASGEKISVYAYGTFKFSLDFNTILGLTEFGKTLNLLTISDFIEEREELGDLLIGKNAFNVKGSRSVEIVVGGQPKTVTVNGLFQKGIFEKLCLKKVKATGETAFYTDFDRSGISIEDQTEIETKMSNLKEVEINNTVTSISERSFKNAFSLNKIKSSGNDGSFKEIKTEAFFGCPRLYEVDLSSLLNLKRIEKDAFSSSTNIQSLKIGCYNGWKTEDGKNSFAAIDLKDHIKDVFLKTYHDQNLIGLSDSDKYSGEVYAYHPSDVDENGVHNKAVSCKYIGHINHPEIYNNIKQGSYFRATKEYFDKGYYENDLKYDLFINENYSVYIKNDTGQKIKLKKIIVQPGAYVILDDNVEVLEGIELNRNGQNGVSGSVGFTYKHIQPSEGTINKVTLGGQFALGFTTNICFNGDELENCTVYGLHQYSLRIPECYVESLSTLGKLCRDITISHQTNQYNETDIRISKDIAKNNQIVKRVILSERVYMINEEGESAFNGCTNLESVYCDSNLRKIGTRAFANCPNLSNFDISICTKLSLIGESAFENDKLITNFRINEKDLVFGSILKNAFTGSGLTNFYLPSKIRKGWKAGGTTIEPSQFESETEIASLLTDKYKNCDWKRY